MRFNFALALVVSGALLGCKAESIDALKDKQGSGPGDASSTSGDGAGTAAVDSARDAGACGTQNQDCDKTACCAGFTCMPNTRGAAGGPQNVCWATAAATDAQAGDGPAAPSRDTGDPGPTPTGGIRCGATVCNVATQDCCIPGGQAATCVPKGTCTSLSVISCSSPSSCGAGQFCCGSLSYPDGQPMSACSSTACAALQLCDSDGDCPGGQPCGHQATNTFKSCDRCAGMNCGDGSTCCPSTGKCYKLGCGSCCM